jgi:hypothetical protein
MKLPILEEDGERVMSIGLKNEHPLVWTGKSGRKSLVIGSSATPWWIYLSSMAAR